MVQCITSARFDFRADILRQGQLASPEDGNANDGLVLTTYQDPDSGEIIRNWQPASEDQGESTPDDKEDDLETFKCMARGIVDGGIRVAGTTERFSDIYEAVDFVRIWFPAKTRLTRRDRVTNIRDRKGNIIWREDEREDLAPTVFSVTGVAPIIVPMMGHTENVALLERVEGQ